MRWDEVGSWEVRKLGIGNGRMKGYKIWCNRIVKEVTENKFKNQNSYKNLIKVDLLLCGADC